MHKSNTHIALFVDDDARVIYFEKLLKDPHRKLVKFSTNDLENPYFSFDEFHLLILDLTTVNECDPLIIASFRKRKHLENTPFLYIYSESQSAIVEKLYKDRPKCLLADPFNQIEIDSLITTLSTLGDMQKNQGKYEEIFGSEKKIVNQIEQILQLHSLNKAATTDEFFFLMQKNIVKKIDLAFAAQRTLVLTAGPEKDQLVLRKFGENHSDIQKELVFDIRNSHIRGALADNTALILAEETMLDPFLQELGDVLSMEMNALLLLPVMVLQKTRMVILIVDKLYKTTFSDSDLALGSIISSKIRHILERLYLADNGADDLDANDILNSRGEVIAVEGHQVLDSVGFGLILFNQEYDVRFANSFARETFDLDKIDRLKMPDIIGDDAFRIIVKFLKKDAFPVLRQEIMINYPETRQLYLGYSLYLVDSRPGKRVYALTFMEISQTKRLQAEIIRMDRMASLGVLASGIAHEIRNPLAGIKAMAQTLQEELERGDPKNEYIDRIVRQVNRLDELLRSFFSYARPQRPNPVRCRIPEIVREVLPLFLRKIKDNNIVVKEIYSRELKEIFVDFHQIEQVFFNLIINAIDSMKEGGTLSIRARMPEETQPIIDRRQRIPKLFSDIYNEITISDTGKGMDGETLNNMYNPFFTTKSNGTGLGLSIVYQIVLEHGGQITVDSVQGRGSTFKILLPVYVSEDRSG